MPRLIGRLARLVASLPARLSRRPEDVFIPELDDSRFRAALGKASWAVEPPAERGLENWKRTVVEHYRDRALPAFFMSVGEVRDTAARLLESDPEYREQIVSDARRQALERFDVYAEPYPGLINGFEWGKLRTGPGHDVLYPVRPHRFGFAPLLALASLWDPPARDALASVFERWTKRVTTGDPFAYSTNLVVLHRILALHWTFVFLCSDPDQKDDLPYEMLKLLHADVLYLSERAGDSIANNHLLADGFALWYQGVQFPDLSGAERWRSRGESIWLRELRRQIYDDGTSFEQSVHYQELALEMALMYVLLSRRNGLDVPAWVEERTFNMIAFQASCEGPHGVIQPLGDTIEDPLIPLDSPRRDPASSFRRIQKALYPSARQSHFTRERLRGRALWLVSRAEPAPRSLGPGRDRVSGERYPQGGYFFLTEMEDEARLLFRTGPAPSAIVFGGHMHDDFLTVYLSIGSHPVFVEAGTYTYRWHAHASDELDLRWREWFLGHGAHNGLAIDAPDALGRVRGDFRDWAQKARTRSNWNMGSGVLDWVEGIVDQAGFYTGHRRGVVHVPGRYFVIYDVLTAQQVSRVPRLRFQLAPGVVSEQGSDGLVVISPRTGVDAVAVCLAYARSRARLAVVEGNSRYGAGWISERYGEVMPAPTLVLDLLPDVDASALVLTTRRGPTVDVQVKTVSNGLSVRVDHPRGSDRLLINTSSAMSLRDAGMVLDGRIAWVRTRERGAVEIRALGVSRFTDGEIEIRGKDDRPARAAHLVHDGKGIEALSGTHRWIDARVLPSHRR